MKNNLIGAIGPLTAAMLSAKLLPLILSCFVSLVVLFVQYLRIKCDYVDKDFNGSWIAFFKAVIKNRRWKI